MTELKLSRNMAHAFSLVEETYRFSLSFFNEVKDLLGDPEEDLTLHPIDNVYTTRSSSVIPEYMFTRAFGALFGKKDETYSYGELSSAMQIPFLFVRLAPEENYKEKEPYFPKLIHGFHTEFEVGNDPGKKRRTAWFERPLVYKENVFDEDKEKKETKVEGENLTYLIKYTCKNLADYVAEERGEQQNKAKTLADEIRKNYRS